MKLLPRLRRANANSSLLYCLVAAWITIHRELAATARYQGAFHYITPSTLVRLVLCGAMGRSVAVQKIILTWYVETIRKNRLNYCFYAVLILNLYNTTY